MEEIDDLQVEDCLIDRGAFCFVLFLIFYLRGNSRNANLTLLKRTIQ